jgi:hypothetical protein
MKPHQGWLRGLLAGLLLLGASLQSRAQALDPLTGLPFVQDSLALAADSLAQDTLQYDLSNARAEYFLPGQPFAFLPLDTGIARFQDSDPAFFGLLDRQTLGNMGQASQPLWHEAQGSVGTDMAGEPYRPYQQHPDSLRYYRVNKPFTQLRYVLGSGVQQRLNFRHSQNIMPNLNASLDYTRTVSEGQSNQQKAGVHDLGTSAWFRSRDQRYAASVAYLFNAVRAEENGGAAIDSVFGFTPRDAAPVQLADAFSEQRRQSVQLEQHLFGRRAAAAAAADSAFSPRWRVWHSFQWSTDQRSYADARPDTAFYGPFLFIPDDTLRVDYGLQRVQNTLGLTSAALNDSLPLSLSYRVALIHRWDRMQETAGFSSLQDLLADAAFGWQPGRPAPGDTLRGLHPFAAGRFRGNRFGEVDAGLRLGFRTAQQRLSLGLSTQRLEPSLQQEFFFSAPAFWDLDLAAERRIIPELRYQHHRAGIDWTIRLQQVQKLLYWDETSRPAQASGQTLIWQALLRQDFTLGHWHLDNTVALQRTESSALNLPLYVGRHIFYYEGFFFKQALFARIGADVRFQSGYTADAWNPLTAAFYLQGAATPDTYPVLDLFFSAIIDRARIMIKGVNLTQGLFDPGWYQTPDYPMPNRGFVLQVDWRFWY